MHTNGITRDGMWGWEDGHVVGKYLQLLSSAHLVSCKHHCPNTIPNLALALEASFLHERVGQAQTVL